MGLELAVADGIVEHAAGAAAHGVEMVPVVALLAAAVIGVPLLNRLGLGGVVG